jgi:hypothetical protein
MRPLKRIPPDARVSFDSAVLAQTAPILRGVKRAQARED